MKRMVQFTVVLVALAYLASSAAAVTLWDQSDADPFGAGFFNSISGAPPMGITVYAVSDVSVDNVWMVNEIVQYYSAIDQFWGLGIFQGVLTIVPKMGSLPVDDPATGIMIPMSGAVFTPPGFIDPVTVVKASGLSIMLQPGEYWIGITPDAPAGFFGPEIQLSVAAPYGDPTASWDMGMPGWAATNGADATLIVNGEIAVPNEATSWGKVKSVYGN